MVFSFQNSFEPMLGYTKSNSIEENQVREKSRHAWKSYLLRTEIDKKKKIGNRWAKQPIARVCKSFDFVVII